MSNKRRVAQPLHAIHAYNRIRSFLGVSLLNDTDENFKLIGGSLSRINIQELSEKRYSDYSKGRKSNTIDEFIQNEIDTANNYLDWSILKQNKGIEYTDSLNGYIKFLENDFKVIAKPSKHEVCKLINYYTKQKYNLVFIDLHHCIKTICDWVKPINTAIDSKYYAEYFINEIEFTDIAKEENKDIVLNNLFHLYNGLINVLNKDINNSINDFLNGIKALSNDELNRIPKEIIIILSQIEQNKSTKEIDISKCFTDLNNEVQKGRILTDLDYRLFIINISNQIAYLLFNSLTIIKNTIKEITPLIETDLKNKSINWINLFDSIEIEQKTKPQVYITNTIQQKKNYFSEASFSLTIQYLTHLKKETYLLNEKRKLDYINSLNIEKPKASNTESPLFNQTVFEAKNNYFEFLTLYKSVLENTLTQKKESEQSIPETNTFCKSMPLSIPKEHFKIFTVSESKNKKTFLTVEQYNCFIERAFCGNTKLPKQKFNQTPKGEKLKIQAVFYDFYNNYCQDYFNTMQCQPEFIKLLTENFIGWNFKNVSNNFTPKTKKRL